MAQKKVYRCKDCDWWKEYGSVCTMFYLRTQALSKKCKHFKLNKPLAS